jgi:hypothetical protein
MTGVSGVYLPSVVFIGTVCIMFFNIVPMMIQVYIQIKNQLLVELFFTTLNDFSCEATRFVQVTQFDDAVIVVYRCRAT